MSCILGGSEPAQACGSQAECSDRPDPAPYQPRSIHSARWGDSDPIVVEAPCPGNTSVEGSKRENRRRSMELMIVGKSPPGKDVLPGPPGKRVSPVRSSGVPST